MVDVAAPVQIAIAPHEWLARAATRRLLRLRHRVALLRPVMLGSIALLAIFGPFVLPDPFFADFLSHPPPAPPSTGHLLGTDTSGRDVLARVVLGARTSLIVGFGAVTIYV